MSDTPRIKDISTRHGRISRIADGREGGLQSALAARQAPEAKLLVRSDAGNAFLFQHAEDLVAEIDRLRA